MSQCSVAHQASTIIDDATSSIPRAVIYHYKFDVYLVSAETVCEFANCMPDDPFLVVAWNYQRQIRPFQAGIDDRDCLFSHVIGLLGCSSYFSSILPPWAGNAAEVSIGD